MTNFKAKSNLIWAVADLLRGDYKQSDYGKVILPMTVLRRLDCVLAPNKQKVLNYLPKVAKLSDSAKDLALNKIAKANFHNRSQFDFARLVADPNHSNYINGYSASAREIIEYFNFDDQIERMDDLKADILFQVVKKFAEIDLSDMGFEDTGYVFEDLIRRFAEQSNETAGEHFTPREVIKLMVNAFFGYWRVTVEQPLTDEKGRDITSRDGSPKPDPKLRDFENIPFLKKNRSGKLIPQTIEEYVEREVKPHLPNAWIDESKTKTGYEINFTKYFYEFKPLRSLAEIKADILALETSSLELEKAVLED